jgi:tRNA G18 (ribose-2'-O)-methylase SpoU
MSPSSRDRHFDASEVLSRPRKPVHLILDNLRSAFNVGSIIRTSDAASLACVHLCGITPLPPHPQIARTALGATRYVPWLHHETALDAVGHVRSLGCRVYALETTERAASYWSARFDAPLALVVGHEVSGITPDVLDSADEIVFIPMNGVKNSINVATSVGIVVYEILRRWDAATP